jgi:FkbM family methyltransferase
MPRTWPAPFRQLFRFALRSWPKTRIAPGYLYFAVERWGKHLAGQPLSCRLFNGCAMMCELREHIQRQIYFFGAYEPIESYIVHHLIEPGMIVIDAGANVGQYTLVAAQRVGFSGQVHAFEPVPGNLELLERHVGINRFADRVKTNACALWDDECNLSLNLGSDDLDENATNYSVSGQGAIARSVESRAVRLDDYVRLNNLDRLDLIKMDIEGAELHALRGARGVLEAYRPTILMEINRARCRDVGYDPEEIWELLRPLGYSMRAIVADPAQCHRLESLRALDRGNVLFFARPLPEGLWQGWSLAHVLADFRTGRYASAKGS